MITFEFVLLEVLLVSAFTGLATEAIKKILTEYGLTYYANTLAGVVSAILSCAVGVAHVMIAEPVPVSQSVIHIVVLVFLSWLCAMVGYDKVVQAIGQFKMGGDDKNA